MTIIRILGFLFFVFGTAMVWRDAKRENERRRRRLEQQCRSAFRRKPDESERYGHCEQDSGDS